MKLIIFAFFGLLCGPVMAKQMKVIAMDEVKKHNNKKSCWIVIDKMVYDVTAMLPHHNKIIKTRCGKDATEGFNTQGWTGKKHSEKAHKIRASKQIGVLKE